nr:transposase [Rhizobium favelukesii]
MNPLVDTPSSFPTAGSGGRARPYHHGRRKLIKAKPTEDSPLVDEALSRVAALYKIEDSIRGCDPDHRRAVRPKPVPPAGGRVFTWLAAQQTASRASPPRRAHGL